MNNEQMNQLLAELQALKAENQALKTKPPRKATELFCKVSQKGAVSVYGLGRFPVTLYKSQLMRLIAAIPEIQAFAKDNDALLTTKEKEAKPTA